MKLFFRLAGDGARQLELIRHQLELADLSKIDEVEISLEGLDVPDSSFLRLLLQLRIYLRQNEVQLRLTNLSDSSARVIHQSSLQRFLDPLSTPDTAAKAPESER